MAGGTSNWHRRLILPRLRRAHHRPGATIPLALNPDLSPIDRGRNLEPQLSGLSGWHGDEKIADYVTRHVIPLADIVLDFHSGGRTLDFLFCMQRPTSIGQRPGSALFRRLRRRLRGTVFDEDAEIDAVGMLDTTVE